MTNLQALEEIRDHPSRAYRVFRFVAICEACGVPRSEVRGYVLGSWFVNIPGFDPVVTVDEYTGPVRDAMLMEPGATKDPCLVFDGSTIGEDEDLEALIAEGREILEDAFVEMVRTAAHLAALGRALRDRAAQEETPDDGHDG